MKLNIDLIRAVANGREAEWASDNRQLQPKHRTRATARMIDGFSRNNNTTEGSPVLRPLSVTITKHLTGTTAVITRVDGSQLVLHTISGTGGCKGFEVKMHEILPAMRSARPTI